MQKKIIATLFTLLFIFQGIYLLGFSMKEGIGSTTLMAIGTIVAPIVLLWITFHLLKRSGRGIPSYLATGLIITALYELRS